MESWYGWLLYFIVFSRTCITASQVGFTTLFPCDRNGRPCVTFVNGWIILQCYFFFFFLERCDQLHIGNCDELRKLIFYETGYPLLLLFFLIKKKGSKSGDKETKLRFILLFMAFLLLVHRFLKISHHQTVKLSIWLMKKPKAWWTRQDAERETKDTAVLVHNLHRRKGRGTGSQPGRVAGWRALRV